MNLREMGVFFLEQPACRYKKAQGQYHLDDILTHPEIIIKEDKKGFEIYTSDGRGAYFRSDGSFRIGIMSGGWCY